MGMNPTALAMGMVMGRAEHASASAGARAGLLFGFAGLNPIGAVLAQSTLRKRGGRAPAADPGGVGKGSGPVDAPDAVKDAEMKMLNAISDAAEAVRAAA